MAQGDDDIRRQSIEAKQEIAKIKDAIEKIEWLAFRLSWWSMMDRSSNRASVELFGLATVLKKTISDQAVLCNAEYIWEARSRSAIYVALGWLYNSVVTSFASNTSDSEGLMTDESAPIDKLSRIKEHLLVWNNNHTPNFIANRDPDIVYLKTLLEGP